MTARRKARADEPVDAAAPPCQEDDPSVQDEPHAPREGTPPVKSTKTLDVFVTRRHNLERATWLEFLAAVTALAEEIPAGVNPSVNVRRITVSWEEKQ